MRAWLLGGFVVGLAVSITLAQTALAALTGRWLWRLATGRTTLDACRPLAGPFAALAVTTLVAAAASARPGESLVVAVKGLLLIAAFHASLDALADVAGAERTLAWLLALMAGVSVVGALQVGLCPWLAPLVPWLGRVATKCERAHGFYSIYMTLAGVLSLVMLAVLPGLLGPRTGRGAGAWAVRAGAWILAAAGLGLTQVRGAWIGLVAGVGILLGLLRRGRLLLLAGVGVLVVALLLVPGIRRRVASMADPGDATAADRLYMWQSGILMGRDHWLTGVGPGVVKHVYPQYLMRGALVRSRSHLHSTPLQILAERGIVGLAAWVWLFVAFFVRVRPVLRALPPEAVRERALVTGSLAATGGFLVGGLFEYNFGDSEVLMVAYLVMAVPFVVARARGAGARASSARQ